MGRGRAKAKQTKVARDLKYRTYEPDLDALQQELSGGQKDGNGDSRNRPDDDEESDSTPSGDDYDDYYADEHANRN
ncbi:DUF3073 domain-containing protein [Flindersiella endophytica]